MNEMLSQLISFIQKYITSFHIPQIRISDVVEMLLIAAVVYYIMAWMRRTKAWSLLKGLLVILAFFLLAAMFNMTTILFIAEKSLYVAATALVVILQPELRRALEQLGTKNIFSNVITLDSGKYGEGYSDHTIDEIVKASFSMGRVKTGALMVLEREQTLAEYEKTGINIDATVSSQLLINIFEHNTPLHDGAVIFRGDRVVSATCYLPLSDNPNLSKALGTRHRAGVGISEVTDALVIIVSEESGKVSVAVGGELFNGLSQEGLREKLELVQDHSRDEAKKGWRGRVKGGRDDKQSDPEVDE